ncbi:hypothetical protein [Phycicoccus duodecadis]|uniref:Uncharacterized protein n=1 Tax=Phycicoccus duodecadis TaxID=173053 RepID=A0A2N3YMT7_9MICO|nr:hypothetical protein [Phycicoccus duodecadis]PKW28118.1 hypothetical protein ATL31_2974 [Phycicoccus duodecadis]
MTPGATGRARARVVGTLLALVTTAGVGVVCVALSDTGWHAVAVGLLVVAGVVADVVLVSGHLRFARGDLARAALLLRPGVRVAAGVALALAVVGLLALLLVGGDAMAVWLTTWLTALVAVGPPWLGAQGLRELREGTADAAPPAR